MKNFKSPHKEDFVPGEYENATYKNNPFLKYEPKLMETFEAPWLKMRPTIFQLKIEYAKYLNEFRHMNRESLKKAFYQGLALQEYGYDRLLPLQFGQWVLTKANPNELIAHAKSNKSMNQRKVKNQTIQVRADFLEAGAMAKKENELSKENDEKYLDEKILRERTLISNYRVSPFDEEAAQNDNFHPPKEEVSINVDIEQLPSIWKRVRGWFS